METIYKGISRTKIILRIAISLLSVLLVGLVATIIISTTVGRSDEDKANAEDDVKTITIDFYYNGYESGRETESYSNNPDTSKNVYMFSARYVFTKGSGNQWFATLDAEQIDMPGYEEGFKGERYYMHYDYTHYDWSEKRYITDSYVFDVQYMYNYEISTLYNQMRITDDYIDEYIYCDRIADYMIPTSKRNLDVFDYNNDDPYLLAKIENVTFYKPKQIYDHEKHEYVKNPYGWLTNSTYGSTLGTHYGTNSDVTTWDIGYVRGTDSNEYCFLYDGCGNNEAYEFTNEGYYYSRGQYFVEESKYELLEHGCIAWRDTYNYSGASVLCKKKGPYYIVTFDPNGGQISGYTSAATTYDPYSSTVVSGSTSPINEYVFSQFEVPFKPKADNAEFKYWMFENTDNAAPASPAYGKYQYGAIITVSENKTLYAMYNWSTTYIVHYNANGGTGAPADQVKTKDKNLTLSTRVPQKPGYKFKKWKIYSIEGLSNQQFNNIPSSYTEYQAGAIYSYNGGTTMYAQWERVDYTLTFNSIESNYISVSPASVTVPKDSLVNVDHNKITITNSITNEVIDVTASSNGSFAKNNKLYCYVFDCWKENDENGRDVLADGWKVATNEVLYAVFEEKQCALVKFNSNPQGCAHFLIDGEEKSEIAVEIGSYCIPDGSNPILLIYDSNSNNRITIKAIPNIDIDYGVYAFTSWGGENGFDIEYDEIESNLTITASFELQERYRIKYDTNGGACDLTGDELTTDYVAKTEYITTQDPEVMGFTKLIQVNFVTGVDFAEDSHCDKSLGIAEYAWSDGNGHYFSKGASYNFYNELNSLGTITLYCQWSEWLTLNSEEIPTPSGVMTFIGWFDNNGNMLTTDTHISDDVTYYARWEGMVTYNANGGEFPAACGGTDIYTENYTYGDFSILSDVDKNPTRTGYVFSGWSTNPNATEPDSQISSMQINPTYYAVWDLGNREIRFVSKPSTYGRCLSSSEVQVSSITVAAETPVSVSGGVLTIGSYVITATPKVSQSGQYMYYFDGWEIPSAISDYNLIPVGDESDIITITANFHRQQGFIVKYYLNASEGESPYYDSGWNAYNTNYTIIDPVSLFERTATVSFVSGISLLGNPSAVNQTLTIKSPAWNTSAYGSGTSYSAGQTISNVEGTINLYCQWNEMFTLSSSQIPSYTSGQLEGSGLTLLGWYDEDGNKLTTLTEVKDGDVFYAKWRGTLTYHKNDGSENDTFYTQTITYGEETTITSLVPYRTNYIFKGWSTNPSATGAEYVSGDTATFNIPDVENLSDIPIHLYAIWDAEYQIIYDLNSEDATGGPNPSSVYTNNHKLNISTREPSLTNYNFLGWSTNSSASEPDQNYAPGTEDVEFDGDTRLFAIWQEKDIGTIIYYRNAFNGDEEYMEQTFHIGGNDTIMANPWTAYFTVSYDLNGAEGPSIEPSNVPRAARNYWCTDASTTVIGYVSVDSKISYTEDNLDENYEIHLYGRYESGITFRDFPVVDSSQYNLVFKYWTASSSSSSGQINEVTLYDNKTIYAQWYRNPTVTYYRNTTSTDSTIDNADTVRYDTDYTVVDKITSNNWIKSYNIRFYSGRSGATLTGANWSEATPFYAEAEKVNNKYTWYQNRECTGNYYLTGDTISNVQANVSLYAKWGEVTVDLRNYIPTAEHYIFLGWSYSSGGEIIQSDIITITGYTPLYAIWREEYLVTYNLNGGQDASHEIPTTAQYTTEYKYTIVNTEPTKANCAFGGWLGSDGNAYLGGIEYTFTENVTLIAQWGQEQVTYNSNNDSGDVIVSEAFTKDNGYTIVGNTNNWTNKYTITFNLNLPENATGNTPADITVIREWTGWNTLADGTGDPYSAGDNVYSTLTLFAQYQSTVSGEIKNLIAEANNSSKYIFLGWDEDSNATTPTYAVENKANWLDIELTEDKELYAIWREEYLVTYNLNSEHATGGPNPNVVYTDHQKLTISNDVPTWTNHIFMGWSEQPNASAGDSRYAPGTVDVVFTRDTNLYAIWDTENAITYDLTGCQDATGTIPTGTVYTQNHAYTIVNARPTRGNAEYFAYWQGSDGNRYNPGQECQFNPTPVEIILTPVFEEYLHVTYIANNDTDESYDQKVEYNGSVTIKSNIWQSSYTITFEDSVCGNSTGTVIRTAKGYWTNTPEDTNVVSNQVQIDSTIPHLTNGMELYGQYVDIVSYALPTHESAVYTFLGWVKEDGTLVTGTIDVSGDMVLTAQWAVTLTVNCDVTKAGGKDMIVRVTEKVNTGEREEVTGGIHRYILSRGTRVTKNDSTAVDGMTTTLRFTDYEGNSIEIEFTMSKTDFNNAYYLEFSFGGVTVIGPSLTGVVINQDTTISAEYKEKSYIIVVEDEE